MERVPKDGVPVGRVPGGRVPRGKCADEPPGAPQDGPFVTACTEGKFAWCRCRSSGRYPLCDGSHREGDELPLKVVLEEPGTKAWCACGRTESPPFCDGSHGKATQPPSESQDPASQMTAAERSSPQD